MDGDRRTYASVDIPDANKIAADSLLYIPEWSTLDFSALKEADDKLLKIKQELESLRPSISWIDDIFISSYDGSLQVELDYTLYPDEIKQLAQIAAKYGMELKYMTGKNATLVKNKINENKKYNQEELLRLDLIARRRFDCDYEKCTDEQKAEVEQYKDSVKSLTEIERTSTVKE